MLHQPVLLEKLNAVVTPAIVETFSRLIFDVEGM
jgi:hypothetical protein